MSGALNSVMGGGNGGLLGAIGGIVGGMFGGPIGAMIGQAIGGMLQSAVGDALKDGVDQLQKEHGMPSFLADLVKSVIDDKMGQIGKPNVPADVQQAAQDHFGGTVNDFKNQVQQDFVSGVMDNLQQSGDSGGKYSGGSWLTALAKAMGKQLGEKTGHLVKLSNELNALPKGSNDPKVADKQTQLMSEMQGVSQELKMFQETVSTVLKGIGEALSGMARKQ